MPCDVSIDNHIHHIPDGPHTIQTTDHDGPKMMQIRKEYQFNFPISRVRVKTWETNSPSWWSGSQADDSMVCQPKLVDDQIFNLSKFIVKADQQAKDPGAPLMYPEHKFGKVKNSFGQEEYETWQRSEAEQKMGRTYKKRLYDSKSVRRSLLQRRKAREARNDVEAVVEAVMEKPELVTGTRIKVSDPTRRLGNEPYAYGTVIELKEYPRQHQGKTLVCMDEPNPETFRDGDSKCGRGYGYFIETRRLKPLASSGRGSFRNVPDHVGVTTSMGFKHDGKIFPPYTVGRLLYIAEDAEPNGGMATVTWFNLPGGKKGTWEGNDGKKVYENCFNVPSHLLRWCWFNPQSYKVRNIWYTTVSEFKEGDYLVYRGERALAVPSLHLSNELGLERIPYFVTKGVVLRHAGWDQSHQSIIADIVGGMPPETWGQKLSFRKNDLRLLDDAYLPPGQKVEVVAEITFKKKNLQGRIGRVILPTDEDGDVGVEFPEDIGAGSLDGAGEQGRCLYVPANTLKETSG